MKPRGQIDIAVAEREGDAADPGRKLEALRRAMGHDFPAPDVDQMLAEIGGYEQRSS